MKKRKPNFELLRVLAMCMIIGLHYLDKGGVLVSFVEIRDTKSYIPWIFEAFFFCSVNIYILITGYFLSEKEVYIKKVFSLWGQVWFYSVVLGVTAVCIGLVKPADMDVYRLSYYLFPVVTEHYWFVTEYLLLYLLLPFINPVLKKMEQKQIRAALLVLIAVSCISKTILPLNLAADRKGYDIVWFICLYLTGAYYKRFGLPYLSSKLRGFGLYVLSSAGIFFSALVLKEIYVKTGHLQDIVTYAYSYNHLFCYLAAIGLFVCFSNLSIKSEKLGKGIGILGSAAFGVYLLHEHIDFRYVWPQWLQTKKQAESPLFFVFMAGSIFGMFVFCAVIELARQKLFQKIKEAVKRKK